jgi:predicted nucleic acid-binding protein
MIAVDSSVLIDILFDGPDAETSARTLSDAAQIGSLALSDVAMAEICSSGDSEVTRKTLTGLGFIFLPTNETAAIRAGEMSKRYRKNGGTRSRIIADFLIGAHALMQCDGLITYDGGFHRDYFKGLRVIVPGDSDAALFIH